MKQKTFYLTKNEFIRIMDELNKKHIPAVYDDKHQRYVLINYNGKISAYKNPKNLPNEINFKQEYHAFLAINDTL